MFVQQQPLCVEFSSLRESGSLEYQEQYASRAPLKCSPSTSLSNQVNQLGVEMTTSETKELALPAVARPPLPEPGEKVDKQSREAVTRTPESEIIIKNEARESASGFQCNEAEETASRRPKRRWQKESASGNRLGRKYGVALGMSYSLVCRQSFSRHKVPRVVLSEQLLSVWMILKSENDQRTTHFALTSPSHHQSGYPLFRKGNSGLWCLHHFYQPRSQVCTLLCNR